MNKRKQKKRKNLGDIFDKHVKHEFIDHDVEATMKTMVKEPYVHHVPMLTGGVGYDEVYNFYKNHFVAFVAAFPKKGTAHFPVRNSLAAKHVFFRLFRIG